MKRENIKNAKRIVIKIGTSVIASKNFALDEAWMKNFAKEISLLLKKGIEVIVVSSGAIAAGMHILNIKKRPGNLPEQQACAALGQGYLIKMYDNFFKKNGFHAAQILLTWDDMREKRRYLNAENTIRTLLNKKVVPVINENDTVSVDEIKFGDNDKLSALVAKLSGADLLIMLTDVDGLFIDNKKTCIDTVKVIDSGIEKLACGTDKECSLGGMKTKLEASKITMTSGVNCVIANGRKKGILSKILKGENIGTFFVPKHTKQEAHKKWVEHNPDANEKINWQGFLS